MFCGHRMHVILLAISLLMTFAMMLSFVFGLLNMVQYGNKDMLILACVSCGLVGMITFYMISIQLMVIVLTYHHYPVLLHN